MSETPTTVTHRVLFGLLAPGTNGVPIEARLHYDVTDPYAVAVVFQTRSGPVEWIFARELLADGLIAAAGEGDIQVRPSADDEAAVLIELRAPTGGAVLDAPAEELADFLDATYDLVLPGEEDQYVDFDRELAKLAIR